MKNIFTILLLALSGIKGLSQSCNPIDLSFGNGGKAVGISTNQGPPYSRNILVQPDNKILHICSIYENGINKFGLIRFDANGQLDNTFGTGGKVFTSVGSGHSYASAGALQPDGKIIVTGQAENGNNSNFALVRYNNDGSLDNNFGTGGKVLTPVGQNFSYAIAIVIQTDGKIVVAGSSGDNKYVPAFALLRFNSDGSLDNAFGQNGKVVFRLGHLIDYLSGNYYGTYSNEYARSVLIQTDGKIIVAGDTYTFNGCYDYYGGVYCNPAFGMARFNVDGSADNSFGNNGKVIDSVSLVYMGAALLQPDGKILVTGTGNTNGFITRRYSNNGIPDNGFGTNGIVVTPISTQNYASPNSMLLQPDGKILAAGGVNTNNSADFVVVRYNPDGSMDNSFNIGGIAVFHPGIQNSNDGATGLALQGNKVLVAGVSNTWSNNNNNFNILILRLNENPITFIPTVTPDGPLVFCEGGRVNLSGNATGTMQWFKNGVSIPGATGQVYGVTSSGSYSLTVTNSNGCGVSDAVNVTANPRPPIPQIIPAGSLIFCEGSSVTLNVTSQSSLQWYKDGNALSGETNPVYTASASGSYSVIATNPPNCSASSVPVIVVSKTTAIPTITANGPVNFCLGGDVRLSTTNTANIQWYKNGVSIFNAISSNYIVSGVSGTGLYTESNGCSPSNSINVIVYANPVNPIINLDKNTYVLSTTTGYTQYQWYLNDVAIPGAVSVNYTVPITVLGTKPGDYQVRVTDINNCSTLSDKKTIDITSPNDMIVGGVRIHYYPNPANIFFYLDLPIQVQGQFRARLFDMTGRLMQTKTLNQGHNAIPVSTLAAGLYQLVVDNGKGNASAESDGDKMNFKESDLLNIPGMLLSL